jgi:hypothetical protein
VDPECTRSRPAFSWQAVVRPLSGDRVAGEPTDVQPIRLSAAHRFFYPSEIRVRPAADILRRATAP